MICEVLANWDSHLITSCAWSPYPVTCISGRVAGRDDAVIVRRPATRTIGWYDPSRRSVPGMAGASASRPSALHLPLSQFEDIRNIHFQSFTSSALARPGNGLVSRPSDRPTSPLPPRSLVRPNTRKYSLRHSSLSADSLAHFLFIV